MLVYVAQRRKDGTRVVAHICEMHASAIVKILIKYT